MYNIPVYKDKEQIDIKKLIFCAKKMLPDMVYNMSYLEGNPFTYPEVQTLLDGVTVGGHKLSDQDQIIRIRDSWDFIFELSKNKAFTVVFANHFINKIHELVAKDEALVVGSFRNGNVGIGGTEYKPPVPEELKKIFLSGIKEIEEEYSDSKTSQAIAYFLFGARNQFFYDGNKRTSRLMANLILISNGQGVLNIKSKDKLEFNKLMIDFYNTGDGRAISDFLYGCIDRW